LRWAGYKGDACPAVEKVGISSKPNRKIFLTCVYRKRQISTDSFLPSKASIAFWEPLLRHVQAIHPDFPYIFCRRLVSILVPSPSTPSDPNHRPDPSYEMYLASWIIWAIETWNDVLSLDLDLRRDTILNLMKALRYESAPLSQKNSA